MPKEVELQIADHEALAIRTALPIVKHVKIPNPVNAQIMNLCAESSLQKLQRGYFVFSFGEIRSISLAVSVSVLVCRGNEYDNFTSRSAADEWMRILAPHFFVLNKLEPILGEFVDEHLR